MGGSNLRRRPPWKHRSQLGGPTPTNSPQLGERSWCWESLGDTDDDLKKKKKCCNYGELKRVLQGLDKSLLPSVGWKVTTHFRCIVRVDSVHMYSVSLEYFIWFHCVIYLWIHCLGCYSQANEWLFFFHKKKLILFKHMQQNWVFFFTFHRTNTT